MASKKKSATKKAPKAPKMTAASKKDTYTPEFIAWCKTLNIDVERADLGTMKGLVTTYKAANGLDKKDKSYLVDAPTSYADITIEEDRLLIPQGRLQGKGQPKAYPQRDWYAILLAAGHLQENGYTLENTQGLGKKK